MRSIPPLLLAIVMLPACANVQHATAPGNKSGATLCELLEAMLYGVADTVPPPYGPMVREALAAGADPNAPCGVTGTVPLVLAVTDYQTDVVQALLDHGADLNTRSGDKGITPLGWAYVASNYDAIEILESHDAPIDYWVRQNNPKPYVYFIAFERLLSEVPGGLAPAERAQYEYEASIMAQTEAMELESNKFALYIESTWMREAKNYHYDPSSGMSPREWRWTARLEAWRESKKQRFDDSVQIDKNWPDDFLAPDAPTPKRKWRTTLCELLRKVFSRSPQDFPLPDGPMVREALAAGTDPDTPCYEGMVLPRHVQGGRISRADPDPNDRCVHGIVPLVLAVQNMQTDMLGALLEYGADVNVKCGEDGLTPLGWAYWWSNYDAIEILQSHDAPIDDWVRESHPKPDQYFAAFERLLGEIPEGLSPAERAQYEYDASIAAQTEAIELDSNKVAQEIEREWMRKAEGREYDPASGLSPQQWRWAARLEAWRESVKERVLGSNN